MIHFKQIMSNIDVHPLLHQLFQHPELWNSSDQWTAGKGETCVLNDLDDIVLRYNKSPDWNKQAFSVLSAAQGIIFDVMRAVRGEHLGKVIISRLRAGKQIAPHIDMMPPGVPPYYQRYQIPLDVRPGVIFQVGDEQLYMRPGDAYWFDNQVLHAVYNDSKYDRVSMLCDIRPFLPMNG